jgi:hypothetical protein
LARKKRKMACPFLSVVSLSGLFQQSGEEGEEPDE